MENRINTIEKLSSDITYLRGAYEKNPAPSGLYDEPASFEQMLDWLMENEADLTYMLDLAKRLKDL